MTTTPDIFAIARSMSAKEAKARVVLLLRTASPVTARRALELVLFAQEQDRERRAARRQHAKQSLTQSRQRIVDLLRRRAAALR